MTGTEFAHKVAESNSELPFVFISGYPENTGAQPDAAAEGLLFLQKPFTVETLATTLREALKHSSQNSGLSRYRAEAMLGLVVNDDSWRMPDWLWEGSA